MRWPVVWLGLSLFVVGCGSSDSPAQTKTATSPPVPAAAAPGEILFPAVAAEVAPEEADVDPSLHLPASFRQRVQDRDLLDRMGAELHRLAVDVVPGAQLYQPRPRFEPESIRVVRHRPGEEEMAFWRGLPDMFTPARGFRAPILPGAQPWPAVASEAAGLAGMVKEELAEEGLMSTLARAVAFLGAERGAADPEAVVEELRAAGFPVDLVSNFSHGEERLDVEARVREVATQLLQGRRLESLACEMGTMGFFWRRSEEGFVAADESGDTRLGLLRMQMGGGYQDGVVPGGALDIMTQLAESLPEVDFLISVPAEFATDFRRMVRDFWPLQRPNHVTLVVEPLALAAWAQDNGKAGYIEASGLEATLVPRYATQDEVSFRFLPGESLLAGGLRAAGHKVVQSALLFQGGNLLVVSDPLSGRRSLLVGEAEVHRNRALGLTTDQALAAFAVEFGVDECVVLPPVSFHIDYDLSVRQHRGRLIVFANDSLSAARLVLARGLAALQQGGVLPADVAAGIREDLSADRWQSCYGRIAGIIAALRDVHGQYSGPLIQLFAENAADAAGANFRVFLTALDLIASRAWTEEECPGPKAYARYVGALRRLEEAARAQRRKLEDRGWTVATVPSMPDLEAGVNFLNGIQDRSRFLMPVHGGFYRSVDQVALEVFRGVLGGEVAIVPIRSAGAQRRHGAVHCVAAAYPKRGSKR